jgi:hypothetical protein
LNPCFHKNPPESPVWLLGADCCTHPAMNSRRRQSFEIVCCICKG